MNIYVRNFFNLGEKEFKLPSQDNHKLDLILEGINKLMGDLQKDTADLKSAVGEVKQAAVDMESRVDAAIESLKGSNPDIEQATADLQALKANFAGFHATVAAVPVDGSSTGSTGAGSDAGSQASDTTQGGDATQTGSGSQTGTDLSSGEGSQTTDSSQTADGSQTTDPTQL